MVKSRVKAGKGGAEKTDSFKRAAARLDEGVPVEEATVWREICFFHYENL